MGQLGRGGFAVLVTVFLARFLAPEAYGLIAMVSVFFEFASALMDCGFRQALIRKKEVTQADYSTMIYPHIGLGLLGYGLLFFSAPTVAHFYSEPRLILLVRVVGLVVMINSLQISHLKCPGIDPTLLLSKESQCPLRA